MNFLDSRVIRVKPNDSKIWWKKISALLEIVNRDLGFYDVPLNTEHSHVRQKKLIKNLTYLLVKIYKTIQYETIGHYHLEN